MRNFLLTFTLLMAMLQVLPAYGQQAVNRTVEGTNFPGLQHYRNFVKNPNCQKNAGYNTAASVSFTANTTSAPLNGISDCAWNPTATAQEISWAIDTMPTGVKNGNCEAKLNYSGDASLVSFFVRNSSGPVASGISLINANNSQDTKSINYPCGDGTAVPVLRSTGDAANVQYSVYAGPATNLGSVGVNTPFVSYASSAGLSGLGTGSATINYAEWSRVGPNIQLRFRFTKDGSGGSGSTSVAISIPAGITISSRITSNYFGGSAGSGVTTNGNFEVYYDTSANNIKFLQNDATNFVGSEFSASASIGGFIEFPVQGWESAGTIMNNAQTYYPRYEATIVADASFSLSSDVSQNGSWIASGSRDSQAKYTLNFTSGTFIGTPHCIVTAGRNLDNTRYDVSAWITAITASSITVQWALNDDQQATIAAAIAATDDSGTFYLSCTAKEAASLPAPVLVGGINTNSISSERLERAELNCDASSSITSQTGTWLTAIGNRSTAACAITIATGIFSATPTCVFTTKATTVQATSVNMTSATAGTVYGASADYDGYLICMGSR